MEFSSSDQDHSAISQFQRVRRQTIALKGPIRYLSAAKQ